MKKPWLAMAVLLGNLVCLSSLSWADLQTGKEAYDRGDYAAAVKVFRPLADQGSSMAQFSLGTLYDKGQGVPQDHQEAARWYRLAADQGNAWAQNNLGVKYLDGEGVPQDYQEAVRWFRLAADQRIAQAQFNLGVLYMKGQGGVLTDYVLAHKWLKLAAEQGHKEAVDGLDIIENKMTPAQIAEAQRMAREWKPKGEK